MEQNELLSDLTCTLTIAMPADLATKLQQYCKTVGKKRIAAINQAVDAMLKNHMLAQGNVNTNDGD